MATYSVTVDWKRDAQDFPDHDFTGRRYSRAHLWHFDGGLTVPGSSSPHVVPAPLSDPAAADPEEAFVAALSSCHMLWFLDLASRRGYVVDRYTDAAEGVMAKNAAGRIAMTVVTLRPEVRFSGEKRPDRAALDALHHEAHERCFIANSVTTDVRCEPIV